MSERPSVVLAPSNGKMSGDTRAITARDAPSAVVMVADDVTDAPICDSVFVEARHSKNRCSSMSTRSSATLRGLSSGGIVSTILTRRPAFGYGSGSIKTVLTTLKTAVDAPIPMERVRTTTAVKPGALLIRLNIW